MRRTLSRSVWSRNTTSRTACSSGKTSTGCSTTAKVTPDRRFLVSKAIRDEFENGRDYYALDGTTVRDTLSLEARPAKEHLEWHASERFKG
jgi:hypothetical protein